MAKNVDLQLSEVTKAQLDALIAGSQLSIGMRYKITDRGDKGITLTGISSNQLSLEGRRTMLCPKSYLVGSLDSNSWKGVWHSTKTVSINDLMIRGGLVWKNLTGAIGTATSDIALDNTNWVLIPKASYSNNEYIELVFNVRYDYVNDWICSQFDKNNNEFGISYQAYLEAGTIVANPVDISDWNYPQDNTTNTIMANNKCIGIWNNVEGIRINGNIFNGVITNNKLLVNSYISANQSDAVTGTGYSKISGNTCGIIAGNVCSGIENNTSNVNYITNNVVVGPITGNSNTGFIRQNCGADQISNNSNLGRIAWNCLTGGSIVGNTGTNSIETNACNNIMNNTGGQIIGNRGVVDITGNSNAGGIANNSNNGTINSNSGTGGISQNANNGSINSNVLGAFDISYAWGGNDITGKTLTSTISYYPYKIYSVVLNQSGTNAPVATVLQNTLNILPGDLTRTGVGSYYITKTGAFTVGKTQYFIAPNTSTSIFNIDGNDPDTINLTTSVGFAGNYSDGALTNTSFEIKVYQ
jgi:hypothetical protein